MKHVIESVVPNLSDPLNINNRRGAIELISRAFSPIHFLPMRLGTLIFAAFSTDIVELLDIKILPYVIFLVVPVLGRMSDPDDEVRLVATNTFATLVKLVPLEVSRSSLLSSKKRVMNSTHSLTFCRLVYPILLVSPLNFSPKGKRSVNSSCSFSTVAK